MWPTPTLTEQRTVSIHHRTTANIDCSYLVHIFHKWKSNLRQQRDPSTHLINSIGYIFCPFRNILIIITIDNRRHRHTEKRWTQSLYRCENNGKSGISLNTFRNLLSAPLLLLFFFFLLFINSQFCRCRFFDMIDCARKDFLCDVKRLVTRWWARTTSIRRMMMMIEWMDM